MSVETMARDAIQNMVHDTTHGQLRNKIINFLQNATTMRVAIDDSRTDASYQDNGTLVACRSACSIGEHSFSVAILSATIAESCPRKAASRMSNRSSWCRRSTMS
jgi:hypothetical protein